MTPCDVGAHVMCCQACPCGCHDDDTTAAVEATVTAAVAGLDAALAEILTAGAR